MVVLVHFESSGVWWKVLNTRWRHMRFKRMSHLSVWYSCLRIQRNTKKLVTLIQSLIVLCLFYDTLISPVTKIKLSGSTSLEYMCDPVLYSQWRDLDSPLWYSTHCYLAASPSAVVMPLRSLVETCPSVNNKGHCVAEQIHGASRWVHNPVLLARSIVVTGIDAENRPSMYGTYITTMVLVLSTEIALGDQELLNCEIM